MRKKFSELDENGGQNEAGLPDDDVRGWRTTDRLICVGSRCQKIVVDARIGQNKNPEHLALNRKSTQEMLKKWFEKRERSFHRHFYGKVLIWQISPRSYSSPRADNHIPSVSVTDCSPQTSMRMVVLCKRWAFVDPGQLVSLVHCFQRSCLVIQPSVQGRG